jgi:hypothetical protein
LISLLSLATTSVQDSMSFTLETRRNSLYLLCWNLFTTCHVQQATTQHTYNQWIRFKEAKSIAKEFGLYEESLWDMDADCDTELVIDANKGRDQR